MKLTKLAIDGYGVCRNLRLGRFNEGLNIIFGATGSGKSTIRRFIRGILFGFDETTINHSSSTHPLGQIEVQSMGHEFRLQRDNHSSAPLQWTASSPSGQSAGPELTSFVGDIDSVIFDSLLNVGFHDSRENMRTMAAPMQTRFGVPVGTMTVRDEAAHLAWQRRQDELRNELTANQHKLNSLVRDRADLQNQIDRFESDHRERLHGVERDLASVDAQLQGHETVSIQSRIAQLRETADNLRQLISVEENNVEYVTQTPQPVDDFSSLYQRLDEIDNQIRRWRRVQNDIQSQRVQLRDEMLVWNELTLESESHPYHKARAILFSMESVVDRTENQIDQSPKRTATHADYAELSKGVSELCQQLRDDIYGLCQELGHQYKHIRHKAAVAELKQLRRCYKEIGENTELLIRRRHSLVDEIRHFDPAGAEAILRADHQFCNCAQHEGYLVARRRYVPTAAPAQSAVTQQVIRRDLSSERSRLDQLEQEINQLHATLADRQASRDDLQNQKSELVILRDQILGSIGRDTLVRQVEAKDAEIGRLRDQVQLLTQQLESASFVESKNHPLLERAAKLLQRLTGGELQATWLQTAAGNWIVRDRNGNTIRYEQLSRGQQDQVYLSFCVATCEFLASRGLRQPLILDDVFANVDQTRAEAILDLLRHCAQEGTQIIVFAKHNEISLSQMDRSVVFELPQTTVSPEPYYAPEREPFVPYRQDWKHESPIAPAATSLNSYSPETRDVRSDNGFGDSSTLMKYPRSGSIGTVSTFEPNETAIVESSSLGELKFIDSINLSKLRQHGITSVALLIDLNPANLPDHLVRAGFSNEQIDRWQAQSWLMVCVPGLRSVDAKLLYACGFSEPEQLDTTTDQQLRDRIHRYLGSSEGSRFATASSDFDLDRINRWYASLDRTRSQWRTGNGYSRRARNGRLSRSDSDRGPSRAQARDPRESGNDRLGVYSSSPRTGRSYQERPESPERNRTSSRPTKVPEISTFANRSDRNSGSRKTNSDSNSDSGLSSGLKFYLNLEDDLEAAPSIGPKTAERFVKIGVVSVGDFLKQTAESMATKINYKRISAKVIRKWQHQTRLVCRIPNLRGHDAQLLVGCGITEAEELAGMQPEKLFGVVGPFSETKEGMKIVRLGKQPDLEEVRNWIDWARNTRSLQAA